VVNDFLGSLGGVRFSSRSPKAHARSPHARQNPRRYEDRARHPQ
jgi:hypothetical protein